MSRPKPAGYRIAPFRGKFAVTWYEGGKRQRRSLGTANAAEAKTLLGQFVANLEHNAKPERMTVTAIMGGYMEAKIGSVSSPGAITFAWKALKPHFGHLLPEHITQGVCEGYQRLRSAQGCKPGTSRNELGVLRTGLSWAAKKEWITKAPYIWRPGQQPPRHRHLSRDEFKRLVDGATMPHVKLFLLLAGRTGGRMTAILELTWDRVDLERGLITLKNPDGMRRKGRATVPISKSLLPTLVEAKQGALTEWVVEFGGAQVKNIRKGVSAAARRSGLKDVSPHVLRHSAAVWMAERGIPMKEIAEVLGHSDDRVTQRVYARYQPEFLRSAVDALE